MAKEVILTGLRANAEFHLGNYLGAILPMVKLQQKHAGKYQLNMFVPDLHSFTTPIDHGKLYEQTHQNLKVFVAADLDIDQPDTFIYRQSYIPAHSELTWILDCFTGFGEASRMTEFKDKSRTVGDDRITLGLFNYPVLMAADILLYGAKWVPVGDDQRQHVEFARDIAIRMNNKFGEIFDPPADNAEQLKFSNREKPVRIRSLRNPEKKMSKSIEDPAGTIMLSDGPEDAARKIMVATTDNLEKKVVNPNFEQRPGVANLVQILNLLKPDDKHRVSDMTYKEFKEIVAKAVAEFLRDFQSKLADVDEDRLTQKLEADEKAMNEIANRTLLRVQKAVGLRPAS